MDSTGFKNRPPPRRPLLWTAVLFLAGTLSGMLLPLNPWTVLVPAGLIVLAGIWSVSHHRLAALWLTVLLVGCLHGSQWQRPGTQLHHYMERDHERMVLYGTIADDPHSRETSRQGRCRWYFTLKTTSVNRDGFKRPVSELIPVRLFADAGSIEPAYGDYLELDGRLQFSERERPVFQSLENNILRSESGHGDPFKALCYRVRQKASEVLDRGLEDQPLQAGLLKALLLGSRENIPYEWKDRFARCGAMHIFSVSGLQTPLTEIQNCGLIPNSPLKFMKRGKNVQKLRLIRLFSNPVRG